MSFWNMTYGDALKAELLGMPEGAQKNRFLAAYEKMGDHIRKHENDEFLTFGEFFSMYCR